MPDVYVRHAAHKPLQLTALRTAIERQDVRSIKHRGNQHGKDARAAAHNCIGSVAAYLFLTEQITAGERQIADGQRQLEKGQPVLEEGKAKLEAGKQEMSESKKEYKQAKDNLFLVLADKLLEGGKGFKDAKERIVEGDKQVAKGDGEVNVGERRIDAVELELRRGRELLMLAKGARVACALVAAFFASLSIVLGFCWRRSLARILMHTDA